MKQIAFQRGTAAWDAKSQTLLHVYALPEADLDTRLFDLADRVRTAGSGYPITWVEPPWLHATIDPVTDQPAGPQCRHAPRTSDTVGCRHPNRGVDRLATAGRPAPP